MSLTFGNEADDDPWQSVEAHSRAEMREICADETRIPVLVGVGFVVVALLMAIFVIASR
ncbi:MAG: hypothetical protein M3O32_01860 [Actinomycetota bacterium]|nr:hypothetical protein [Actinomycetota bacterium]